MLVLTRKLQEKIRIGDQVTITVLRMKGKAVRLGIEAPLDVNVIRGELCFDLADDDNEEARSGGVKSAAARDTADLSSEATGHWPLTERDARDVSRAPQASFGNTSPLRAMVEARPV